MLGGWLRETDLPHLLASRVEVVTLREPQDFKVSFEEGYQYHEQGDWENLAAAMERSICDQPEGENPRKIRSYGMKFRDYVPHFYLGLAWQKLDRCNAALAAWERSEATEDIQEIAAKYSQLQEGRSICAARIETASR